MWRCLLEQGRARGTVGAQHQFRGGPTGTAEGRDGDGDGQEPALPPTFAAMTNRLGGATSAYLRSAAHQPIHWYPWGEEAFEAARREDRPVLLDIGAVWCHWCHVMDGESYEDAALADFLNRHFICIKVDRDERPDVDARYQRAVQAITRQGGWPLTAFLTPRGEVFYGGTYFPPDGKYGRPGFRSVLEQVHRVYHGDRERVEGHALALRRALADSGVARVPASPSTGLLDGAAEAMARVYDPRHGGFGSAPKFPHPAAVSYLLERWLDTGDESHREIAGHTLQAMAQGGVHDQLGGGFHRYSVDERWVVPHFEKMAYDNAALLHAYLDGYAALGDEAHAATARGILGWVRDVLAHPDAGYGASQDADVGLDDDGDYFTWTTDEAREAIGDEALYEIAAAAWDIGTAGEMSHNPSKNVLFVAADAGKIARQFGLDPAVAEVRLEDARARLLAARQRRPSPQVDPTRYTSWNAMLAGALIRAGAALDVQWAVAHGLATLAWIRAGHPDPAALRHHPDGVGGMLDDQVQVAAACLEAFEVTGDDGWLGWSMAIMDRCWRDYRDPEGGLHDTASAAGEGLLPNRLTPIEDAPTPSPNGVAALTMARLAAHTGDAVWSERRDAILTPFAGLAPQLGVHGGTLARALSWAALPETHLVVVEGKDPDGGKTARAMHRAALRAPVPRRVVRLVAGGRPLPPALPAALQAMAGTGTGTRAYACSGTSCQAPALTTGEWEAALLRLSSPGGA
jgi:uncharacterized protein YyaL (SSP411 family)